MNDNLLQWVAITIESIGLVLIVIELYFPKFSKKLEQLFDQTKPIVMSNPIKWIGIYIFIWVIAVIGMSLWDQSMSLIANVFFTVLTVLVLFLLGISKMFVRLGVALGRGNSVGGVGLVLAIVGLSIEAVQLVIT